MPAQLKARLARIHHFSLAEIQKLLSVIADLRDKAIFLVAYRHGLRASEIVNLQVPDIDLRKPKLAIRRIARGHVHDHPLQPDEVQALERYLKTRTDECTALFLGLHGQPISRRGLDWLMKSYGALAKLPAVKCHFHALKHSVAVHLLAAGVELEVVHRWLGHTAVKNTSHYTHLIPTKSDSRMYAALLGSLPS